jgi:hypothetical protein
VRQTILAPREGTSIARAIRTGQITPSVVQGTGVKKKSKMIDAARALDQMHIMRSG